MTQDIKILFIPIIVMSFIVLISNILVQFLLGNWLTWGALTYPFAFLVTDITNRFYGLTAARKVVLFGFIIGLFCSFIGTQLQGEFGPLVTLRIALGSATAFIVAHFLDISIFNYFREENYTKASEFYELALSYNQENYLLYENLAIAYDLSEMYSKALNYYDIVIDQFKPIDGRVEFYKGLMLIKTGDTESGCKYIKQSSDKNFILNTTKISASNVLVSLCSNN